VTLSEPVASGGASLDFSTGFLSADTRVLHWQQVDAQPALFLRRTGVLDQVDAENFFSITTLECEAWIYCNAGQNPDAKPDDTLTALENWCERASPPMAIMVIRASHWAALPTGAGSRENRRLIGRSGAPGDRAHSDPRHPSVIPLKGHPHVDCRFRRECREHLVFRAPRLGRARA
jgi:hypothetical protein